MSPASSQIFLSEFVGTGLLILLGAGVVANHLLPGSKGRGGGNLMINLGWGLGVFVGVYAAYRTGGHLNPAVTLALAMAGDELAPGVAVTPANITLYVLAQLLGALVGAVGCWLAYKRHFDEDAPAGEKLAIFATAPAIRSYAWNLVTEIIATYVLIAWVLVNAKTPTEIGPLAVALVVVGIGASLGGPTGYAINPARDLGPRIAHALLPIRGKGSSDWKYAWVPVVGPLIGAALAALTVPLF